MTLKVIGAGLGRTATFSMKFGLEHLGLGPCYHMSEVFTGARRNIPLWIDAINGKPDWDTIFQGYQSTTDYPACSYWRELADYYPQAKIVLTVRDPDTWFDSVSKTIFSKEMNDSLAGSPAEVMMQGAIFRHFGDRINDRIFMTEWFENRNKEVIDTPPRKGCWFTPRKWVGNLYATSLTYPYLKPLSRGLTAVMNLTRPPARKGEFPLIRKRRNVLPETISGN